MSRDDRPWRHAWRAVDYVEAGAALFGILIVGALLASIFGGP